MQKEEIWKMALASGLCDPDLSSDSQICTDYGDATEAVEKFASMIAAIEREACALICEVDGHKRNKGLCYPKFNDAGYGFHYAELIRTRSNVEFSERA